MSECVWMSVCAYVLRRCVRSAWVATLCLCVFLGGFGVCGFMSGVGCESIQAAKVPSDTALPCTAKAASKDEVGGITHACTEAYTRTCMPTRKPTQHNIHPLHVRSARVQCTQWLAQVIALQQEAEMLRVALQEACRKLSKAQRSVTPLLLSSS